MDGKVIQFDLGADELLDMADAHIEEGEYIAALRLLHRSLELYGPAADEYASLADAYEEMELYEESLDCWFRFLDLCTEEEKVDGYEGLAACYYNLGNEEDASYYYRKMLSDKYLSPSNNVEMGELLERPARSPLKVAWPPEKADHSEEIDAGLRALRTADFDTAEKSFRGVPAKSSYHSAAMNYLAVTYLLKGEPERAEEVCRELLEAEPENVQALSTYAAVLTELERPQDSRAVAEKLAKLPAESADELYKIATVCCENGLYAEAYDKFCRLERMVGYDRTLLFFKGVSAFRAGNVQESLATFGKLLDIYPEAAVARYYFRSIRTYAEEGGDVPETSFFYRLPRAEREARRSLLAELAKMRLADLRAYCRESDLTELLEWCFDEADAQDTEMQLLGATVASRAEYRNFCCNVMLSVHVPDPMKLEMLRILCLRNRSFSCGFVLGNIYREIDFTRLNVGRAKHAHFVAAYASAFARYGVPTGEDGEIFRRTAEAIYAALESHGWLALAEDEDSLACAIGLAAFASEGKMVRSLFGSSGRDATVVATILSALRDAATEAEVAAAEEQKEGAPEGGAEQGNAERGGPREDGDETH